MTNVSISPDGQNIQSDLIALPDEHMTHMWHAADDNPKYEKLYADYVLNEVHLYAYPDSNRAPGHYILPLNNVWKTEILQKDTIRTRKNHVRSILLGVGGTVVVVGVIGAVAVGNALADWSGH